MKNDRTVHALTDLLENHNIERTAFSIINRYVRFADCEKNKRRTDWENNESWDRFIGKNRFQLQLTSDPQPYTLERTLNWLGKQVAPTWKLVSELDKLQDTSDLEDMVENTEL